MSGGLSKTAQTLNLQEPASGSLASIRTEPDGSVHVHPFHLVSATSLSLRLESLRAVPAPLGDGSGLAPVNCLRRLCQMHLSTAAAKNHSLVEREYILAALERNNGNCTLTAAQLEIGPATLFRKLKRYGDGPWSVLLVAEAWTRVVDLITSI